ncbi:hypothetical protein ALC57_18234 [Trachymyrmex cornetzi]|uniref:Uncharacterized protein n=1 Tax=Trachymyrmex cornetzi TaxID=471704 RepID=A0A195DA02_9HYME|nr:hypothetical protein ALC57_18234 [Trachymyrmex cornetzi]
MQHFVSLLRSLPSPWFSCALRAAIALIKSKNTCNVEEENENCAHISNSTIHGDITMYINIHRLQLSLFKNAYFVQSIHMRYITLRVKVKATRNIYENTSTIFDNLITLI